MSAEAMAFGTPDAGRPPRMRFAVDGWDPTYGTSLEVEEVADSPARVVADVERAVPDWAPIPPQALDQPDATVFVDGVRREEARIWIDEVADDDVPDFVAGSRGGPSNEASAALCASYAAGAVCCCGSGAHLMFAEVRRGLFTVAEHASDVATWAATYAATVTQLQDGQGLAVALSAALQEKLTNCEIVAAVRARDELAAHGVDPDRSLLVVDGSVRGAAHLPRVLGFIKSHQLAYLDRPLHAMVGTLAAGERTPVFLLGTRWDRYTWYLRLPCQPGQPWAGIARVECAATLDVADVVALADLSQVVLPRYASVEYKDARAPQNLFPLAGLEKELRRRLGQSAQLYRALRQAAVGARD